MYIAKLIPLMIAWIALKVIVNIYCVVQLYTAIAIQNQHAIIILLR